MSDNEATATADRERCEGSPEGRHSWFLVRPDLAECYWCEDERADLSRSTAERLERGR